jgi:hypothetical protein
MRLRFGLRIFSDDSRMNCRWVQLARRNRAAVDLLCDFDASFTILRLKIGVTRMSPATPQKFPGISLEWIAALRTNAKAVPSTSNYYTPSYVIILVENTVLA